MSAFDITQVFIEIVVGETEDDSLVTSFRHYRTNEELRFGIKDMLLCDVEMHFADRIEFPKEPGKYKMHADWNDDTEVIECIYDVERLSE